MASTFFFRDLQTLELLAEHMTPFVTGMSNVNIWDAGCATGQEPYTVSIVLAEKMGDFTHRNFRIFASDLDPHDTYRPQIEAGEYPDEEVSRVPPQFIKKYFVPSARPGFLRVCDQVREKLTFIKNDLTKLTPVLDSFSLVLCKNVLLHFDHPTRIQIIRMFHSVLVPGGFFAMENTQKMPDELKHLFEPVVSNAQLFKKKAA